MFVYSNLHMCVMMFLLATRVHGLVHVVAPGPGPAAARTLAAGPARAPDPAVARTPRAPAASPAVAAAAALVQDIEVC